MRFSLLKTKQKTHTQTSNFPNYPGCDFRMQSNINKNKTTSDCVEKEEESTGMGQGDAHSITSSPPQEKHKLPITVQQNSSSGL